MKKSKLSISLVTTFIAAMSMSACSKAVTSNDHAIVTFTGYDGQEVEVITNDIYYEYSKSSSGIGKFYDAMLEVLIRYEFQNSESVLNKRLIPESGEELTRSFAKIKAEAAAKVVGLKDQAKKDSKNNGTKYDDEWQKVLDSYNAEDEKELLQRIIYNLEKEEIEDWYFRVNKMDLLSEYIGVQDDGTKVESEVPASFPYHIRHILASVSDNSSFYNGVISSDEASKLYTIVKFLVDGKESFGQIAKIQSEDSGSAALFGSLGIMDTSTSFVNEFKLGLYAYDAIYSGRTTAVTAIEDGLGINGSTPVGLALDGNDTESTVRAQLEDIGLGKVPVGVFDLLNEYKDTDKDEFGHEVNENASKYYPRNVYWNKYLNRHNVFVITNHMIAKDANDTKVYFNVDGSLGADAAIDDSITVLTTLGKCGFRNVPGVCEMEGEAILTDEEGRPIICVKSEHGIHFMIMEKSIYDNGLTSYYAPVGPDDEGYDEDADTYVNYITSRDKAEYNERVSDLENKIKSFDSTYSYRLYETLVKEEGENISFTKYADDGFDLEAAVKRYIETNRENNLWNAEKTINDSWRTYLELINVQNDNRIAERMIPELCALRYNNGNSDDEYKEGGACYYVK